MDSDFSQGTPLERKRDNSHQQWQISDNMNEWQQCTNGQQQTKEGHSQVGGRISETRVLLSGRRVLLLSGPTTRSDEQSERQHKCIRGTRTEAQQL